MGFDQHSLSCSKKKKCGFAAAVRGEIGNKNMPRLGGPFKPPTSRAAAFLVAVAPATGIAVPSRKVHPLTFGFRRLIPDHDRLSRFRSRLRDELKFSESFAVNLEGIRVRLRYHCRARVRSVTKSNKCATHVFEHMRTESCFVKAPADNTSESLQVVSEFRRVLACKGTQQGMRGVCQGSGSRSL